MAMSAKPLAAIAAQPLQSCRPMTHLPSSLEVVPADQLVTVTGGGIGASIGALFGAKGAQWGGIADQIIAMFQGMGTAGASSASSAAGGPGSSGGGSSGGGNGGGGGGGWMSFLGNLGKLFGSFGGKSSGGGTPTADAGQ